MNWVLDTPRAITPVAEGVASSEAADKGRETSNAFRPFPVDALPRGIRQFVERASKAIDCDSSYVALPVLSGLSAAIGNTRRLKVKEGWEAPPSIWTAIVGDSGSAKSPALKAALKPIRIRQIQASESYESELTEYRRELQEFKRASRSKGSQAIEPMEPAAPTFLINDVTVEAIVERLRDNPRGVLLSRDELSGWFNSMDRYSSGKGGDVSFWLSAFDSDAVRVDRKTGDRKTLFVRAASVAVTGGIQPGILYRSLRGENLENGLAARFLFANPPTKPKRWNDNGIDQADERRLANIFARLYLLDFELDDEGREKPVIVRLDDESKREYVDFYNAHNAERQGFSGDLQACWSKLEQYPLRLALVHHLSRWASEDPSIDEGFVDLESMKAAIRLIDFFKNEAKRLYGFFDESNGDGDVDSLIEWIDSKGGSVTASQLQQARRKRFPTSADAEAALNRLKSMGVGGWKYAESGKKGGRPKMLFVLSSEAFTNY